MDYKERNNNEKRSSRDRERDREKIRARSRDKDRGRDRSRDKDRGRARSRDNDRGRDRSRDKDSGRDRSRDNDRGRGRSRDRESYDYKSKSSKMTEKEEKRLRRKDEREMDYDALYTWGEGNTKKIEEEIVKEDKKEESENNNKPNFAHSGLLALDKKTGNSINGVVLKFTEPYESAMPTKRFRFFVYKGKEIVETLHLHRKNFFLIGRDIRVTDINLAHESISKQHAVIQYREVEKKKSKSLEPSDIIETVVKPYIMDLESTHGTFLNGKRIESGRYYELFPTDLVKFGQSSRDYIFMEDKKE